jgi:trehalose 6-phosphate phosphatase
MAADEIARAASAIRRASSGRHLLLLLDFDGTLAEFDTDPEAVFLTDERRRLLLEIHDRKDATVAIVSGRRLADVRARARLPPDNYHAGLHGLEIEGHGDRFEHPDVQKGIGFVRQLVAELSRDFAPVEGVFVEDKTLSAVVHFRGASAGDMARVPSLVNRRVQDHLDSGELRIMLGAGMIEILPNIDWNKGHAVAWIRERVAAASALPTVSVYIGDDVTDQDAFGALGNDGVSVAASSRVSGADFRVDGPSEVEALLRRVALP